MTKLLEVSPKVIDAEQDETIRVPVNYDWTVEEAALAGNYKSIHADVNSRNFPRIGKGIVERDLVVVHLGVDTDIEVMNAKLKDRNRKHATIWELLALGERFPEKQCDFIIRAYGSVCQGDMYVHEKRVKAPMSPGLGTNAGDRYVSLSWAEAKVSHHIRILVLAA
ncbi:MAG: hypothetical protein AAB445_01440 [Patescibacteria group bacterium]